MQLHGQQLHVRDLQCKDLEAAQYWMHPSREWHQFDGPYYPPTPEDEIPGVIHAIRL